MKKKEKLYFFVKIKLFLQNVVLTKYHSDENFVYVIWRIRISNDFFFLSHTEKKSKTTTAIIIGGFNECNLLCEKPNNKSENGNPVINSPLNSSLDFSSLLSYSIYHKYFVLVMKIGPLLGIGDNDD